MKILFFIIIVCSFSVFAQTWHDDGSIISNDGTVIRESYAVRYQEALDAYNRGEEIEDWPVVRQTKKGKAFGKKGYFGESILEVGAPLLAIDKVTGNKNRFMNNLAKQNGFIDDQTFNLTIIVNSNEDFKNKNNISQEDISELKESYDALVEIGVIGQDMSKYNDLSEILNTKAIDPSTGNAVMPSEELSQGGYIDDKAIEIEGVESGDSLAVIANKLNLDSSLVTSRAMAETLSSISAGITDSISSGSGGTGTPAMDPSTGNAPRPPD